jgi:hypothetical protein
MSSKKLVKNLHSGYESKQAANYIEKFFCTFWRLYTVFAVLGWMANGFM